MTTVEDFGNHETAWCPGCGNFGILTALKKALADSGLDPQRVLLVSGIGQAAKLPHYINANVINGLHGRSVPTATAARLANHDLAVIAVSGDGCHYAEGGNHFLHAIRRNINITILVHDNQVYGLTQGQASPTSEQGFVNKAQPLGAPSAPFNPLAVAVAMRAGMAARGFSGLTGHLAGLISQAIAFPGLAVVDILQPCVSFNKVNTFAWYKQRVQEIDDSHDPADWERAMKTALQWGDVIPIGVIYKNEQPSFESRCPALKKGTLIDQPLDREALKKMMRAFA